MTINSWPKWLPIRDELKELSPYGAPQMENIISLNTNENPFPLPAEVISKMELALSKVFPTLNRYPDRDATKLRMALSRYINEKSGTNFSVENIWAANGSNEILQTLMLACGGRGALGFLPSYSVHALIARTTGTKWNSSNRSEDFTLDISLAISKIKEINPGLIFITTPNNPTGNALKITEIETLASSAADIGALLIVDEAYAEFSTEVSAVTLINEYPNLVVVRTMSKAFAFAGARVGYLIGNPKIVEAALITRLPYHLSSQSQAIALAALECEALLQKEVALLISERERVVHELKLMNFQVANSSANFFIFKGFNSSASDVWEKLVSQGILVRDIGIEGFLRVSIGTPEENNKFLTAIQIHKP